MLAILDRLRDGRKHRITEPEYVYVRDHLIPIAYAIPYQGNVWDFGVGEAGGHLVLFTKQGEAFFAIEAPYVPPFEGGSIAGQVRRWIVKWIEIGLRDSGIREATDPPFNLRSFHECQTDEELLECFRQGNGPIGQAFHIGNLCFINQGSDVWLPIKEGTPFESLSFGRIIASRGIEAARTELDRIRATSVPSAESPDFRWRL